MVNAWATANSISLGQVVAVRERHEITAIAKLLEMLVLKEAIVSSDTAGCLTETAQNLVAGGADPILNVKRSQPMLCARIEAAEIQTGG